MYLERCPTSPFSDRPSGWQLPGVVYDLTAAASRGELKCVVCSAAVEWPGERSAPYSYEEAAGSKGRGRRPGAASLGASAGVVIWNWGAL